MVCPVVNVWMCLRGYTSMALSLYVRPTICGALVGQPISRCVVSQHLHLLGLELADSSNKALNMPVDMLVGSDYYWPLVTGKIRRGAGGLVAVHTKLGWVLSGLFSLDNYSQCSTNLSVVLVPHSETHLQSSAH